MAAVALLARATDAWEARQWTAFARAVAATWDGDDPPQRIAVFVHAPPALLAAAAAVVEAAVGADDVAVERALAALSDSVRVAACRLGHASAGAVSDTLARMHRVGRGAHMVCASIGTVAAIVRAELAAAVAQSLAVLVAARLVTDGITAAAHPAPPELSLRPRAANGRIDADVRLSVSQSFSKSAGALASPSAGGRAAVVYAVVPDGAGEGSGPPRMPAGEEVAAYFAACVDARRLEIWGDCAGLFTAREPSAFPRTSRLLRRLDHREAMEVAAAGTDVVHPACVDTALSAHIPIRIAGIGAASRDNGTLIVDRGAAGAVGGAAGPRAVRVQRGITLVSMETLDMWRTAGFLSRLFACFERARVSIDLISTSETNVTASVDSAHVDPRRFADLLRDLSHHCGVSVIEPCAVVAVIGLGVGACAAALDVAAQVGAPVYLVSKSASDVSLSLVVDEARATQLEAALHEALFGDIPGAVDAFGPTHAELEDAVGGGRTGARSAAVFAARWWQAGDVVRMAPPAAPLYVYHVPTLIASADRLTSRLRSVSRFFFAIKANPNRELMRILKDRGFGFECVSPGELQIALSVLGPPSPISSSRILYTPNFASRADYDEAFELGCHVTVDGLFPLERWPACFANRAIILRVDTGGGRGHHAKVVTAGGVSKFGIPVAQMARCAELCRAARAVVVGLHAHVGSGITTEPGTWGESLSVLRAIAREHFGGAVRIFNVGGGLGVPDRPSAERLDLDAVEAGLQGARGAGAEAEGWEVWMEPGRYLVAECGVLLSRVTQTKDKGDGGRRFVGVTAGMHALVRPALYDAHHEVVNASRVDANGEYPPQPMAVYDVVGPICESGDVLAHKRLLPAATTEGDVLVIECVGAYGRSMASTYNARPLPDEVLVGLSPVKPSR